MTDYLTNLSARSLNKARVVRPRVPMHFESFYQKDLFSQNEPQEIAKIDGHKRWKPYAVNSSVTEDIKVEPRVSFTEEKQLTFSKPQTLKRTGIMDKVISRQTQTQIPDQHEVIYHQIQVQQPEKPKRKLAEDMVGENEMIEPGQINHTSSTNHTSSINHIFSINDPKLKRVAPHKYPHVLPEQESIEIQLSTGDANTNDVSEVFPSPEILKLLTDKAQKPLVPAVTGRRTGAPIPANQETGRSEQDNVKTFLSEKQVRPPNFHFFTGVPMSGLVFTPKVLRKYSQGSETDVQKTTTEEKSIQVTIGRIEIRAVPPDKPQKQRLAPQVMSLKDYSKRHTQEVDR